MRYNLYELTDNKELCKEVIEKKFTIKTSIDKLKALDFANIKMRPNHIKAFELIYEIGGKDLFEAILKDGKTCLTKNPNAAKIGVVPLNGAEGYYLKANIGTLGAFMSIINGLKLLDDAGDIYLQDEQEDDLDTHYDFTKDFFESDEIKDTEDSVENEYNNESEEIEENEEVEDMKKDTIPQAKDYSVIGSKIIDNKTGEEVKLKNDWNDNIDINVIEPIFIGTQFIGYKYKSTPKVDFIEENILWGFISKSFLYVSNCLFNGFFEENGRIIAYTQTNYGMVDIVLSDKCMVKFKDEITEDYQFGKRISINKDWLSGFEISECETDKGKGILCMPQNYYFDDTTECKGKFLYISNDDNYDNQYNLWYSNGFLRMTSINDTGSYSVPAPYRPNGYDMVRLCCLAIEGIDYGFNVVEKAGPDEDCMYIIEKDGYFGFATLRFGHDTDDKYYRISKWLAPCAFTKVTGIEGTDVYIVDQFGKKGVFNPYHHIDVYSIPCEYEYIEFDSGTQRFYVEKAGLSGYIWPERNYEGKVSWSESLQRKDNS